MAEERKAVLIEDNLMFGMMVEPTLKRLGYAVKTLAGGPGTVEGVEGWEPDVVFINLTSTRYTGTDLVRQLRARPALQSVGIIGYAGHVESEYFQTGREAGADLVVPNSAMKSSLPEVLEKLAKRT